MSGQRELLCPFPTRVNPATEAAHDATRAWAIRHGLVSSENIWSLETARYRAEGITAPRSSAGP